MPVTRRSRRIAGQGVAWALSVLHRLAPVIALTAALPALAQDPAATPFVVLDQERLFQGSRAAMRLSAEIEQATLDLAAENRQIEAELSAEELELTEARPTMDPEAFRALADAFDMKVQRLRAEQDAKELALTQRREEDRQGFLRRITPVLAELARERGALAILDRRVVVLSAGSIDITDEAIARIDERFDTAVEPAPEVPPLEAPPVREEVPDLPDSPAPDVPPETDP